MAGIEVDPQWLKDYAKRVRRCAEDLENNKRQLDAGHLPAAAFGELGKQVRTAEAYQRASATLLAELGKANTALSSAGDELDLVAGHHDDAEADNVRSIRKAMRD